MQLIQNILSANQILTASLLSWFVAQVLKTIINFILLGKFQLERMWGDGGMPSAHSATVCAMAIVTGRSAGVSSPIFAVACVVAIITMHDAMGVRREAGRHTKAINELLEMLDSEETPEVKLKEFLGHTPMQVCCGAVLGFIVALALG